MYRRLILAVAVLVLMNGLRLAADDPNPAAKANEAERLFRLMEKKLSESKTIECAFEINPTPGQGADHIIRLLLADGNKMRMEFEHPPGAEGGRILIISDGTKLVAEGNLPISEGTKPTRKIEMELPKSLNKDVVRLLTLAGLPDIWRDVILSVGQNGLPVDQEGEKHYADKLQASGFRLGKKGKISGRDAQVIEYDLMLEGLVNLYGSATFWMDTKTNLPLKLWVGDKKIGYTVTYKKLTLDGKIDEKKFKLPK